MEKSAPKKSAWMNLQEHHMPKMKGMELGKRYRVQMEIEPTELSTGENEYGIGMMGTDGKKVKEPMRGKFKVHNITHMDEPTKAKKGSKTSRY